MIGKGGKDCQRARVDPTTQAGADSDQSVTGPKVANPAPRSLGATFFTALENPLYVVLAVDHPVTGTEVSDDAGVGVGCFLGCLWNILIWDLRRVRLAKVPTQLLRSQILGQFICNFHAKQSGIRDYPAMRIWLILPTQRHATQA